MCATPPSKRHPPAPPAAGKQSDRYGALTCTRATQQAGRWVRAALSAPSGARRHWGLIMHSTGDRQPRGNVVPGAGRLLAEVCPQVTADAALAFLE
jgi:hypothetical protein